MPPCQDETNPLSLTPWSLPPRMCAPRFDSAEKLIVLFERRPALAALSRREFIEGSVAVIGAGGLRLPVWAQTTAASGGANQLLLGVDFYPDQTPEALWEEDSRMMAETGFTNVRIAE